MRANTVGNLRFPAIEAALDGLSGLACDGEEFACDPMHVPMSMMTSVGRKCLSRWLSPCAQRDHLLWSDSTKRPALLLRRSDDFDRLAARSGNRSVFFSICPKRLADRLLVK